MLTGLENVHRIEEVTGEDDSPRIVYTMWFTASESHRESETDRGFGRKARGGGGGQEQQRRRQPSGKRSNAVGAAASAAGRPSRDKAQARSRL